MDSATGEAPARRRRARGRKLPSTPAAAGTVLVRARQELGLGLVDVRDRTGVSLPVLEALETGDLTGLDPDLAALGLRRYADLMGLDGEGMCRALNLVPQTALVGAGTGSRSTGAVPALAPAAGTAPAAVGFAGHLRQYPGDGMHLQAFTQTAQVPSVGGGLPAGASSAGGHDPYGSGQVFGTTGMYPATPPLRIRQVVRPAARPVRWLVWLTAGLLVAAGAGLVVAHAKPTWMRRLHLARVPHAHVAVPPTTSSPSAHRAGAAAGSSIVSTGIPGPTGTTVTVRAQNYTVLVQAIAPCWVMATTPQAATPAFNATMAPGTSQVLTPVNGQLTVELGASGVLVSVKVGPKTVPGWSYAPSSAPVTLVFTNTPAPTTP